MRKTTDSTRQPVPHAQLQQGLQGLSLPLGASEAHGLLCGLICGNSDQSRELWLLEVLPEGLDMTNLSHKALAGNMLELFQQSQAGLSSEELAFDLLLPDGDRPLAERAAALVDWCQGFVYGLGLGGIRLDQLSEEGKEGLSDLIQITQLAQPDLKEDDREGEQAEADLMQLCEFTRTIVLLIYLDQAVLTQPDQRP